MSQPCVIVISSEYLHQYVDREYEPKPWEEGPCFAKLNEFDIDFGTFELPDQPLAVLHS